MSAPTAPSRDCVRSTSRRYALPPSVEGTERDSQALIFTPQTSPQAGNYVFDVNDVVSSGSAGAMTLVLQTVLLPLALADGDSRRSFVTFLRANYNCTCLYIDHLR
jgi:RNA 3'-terminal phosphate cyclase (ATP)